MISLVNTSHLEVVREIQRVFGGEANSGVPINAAIDSPLRRTRLHGIAHVSDPSYQLVDNVEILSMEDAQAPFSQNESSGYPKLYLIKNINCGISSYLSDESDTAPGLLPYSSALPLQPGGSLQHVRPGRMASTLSSVF